MSIFTSIPSSIWQERERKREREREERRREQERDELSGYYDYINFYFVLFVLLNEFIKNLEKYYCVFYYLCFALSWTYLQLC
jgi:hypothetical protein